MATHSSRRAAIKDALRVHLPIIDLRNLVDGYAYGVSAPMHTLAGHGGAVCAMAALPDGRLATGSCDGTVRVWDVASGACSCVLRGHSREVSTLVAGLPEELLASGSEDGRVCLWDVGGGLLVRAIECQSAVYAMVALGGRLAVGTASDTVSTWAVGRGACQLAAAVSGRNQKGVFALAQLSGGGYASGHGCGDICVWGAGGARRRVLSGHSELVYSLSAQPELQFLASASCSGVRLWDLADGCCIFESAWHAAFAGCALVAPGGRAPPPRHCESTMHVLQGVSVRRGADCATMAALSGKACLSVVVMRALPGDLLASGGVDGAVRIWDPCAGRCIRTLACGPCIQAMVVSQDGWLAAGLDDGRIQIWA
jgi:WD40 repeat protein